MRSTPSSLTVLLLAFLFAPAAGSAQQGSSALALRILSAETRQPLTGVQVQVKGVSYGTGTSDDSGRVRIDRIPPGLHPVEVRRIGYRTHQMMLGFMPDQPVEGDIEMAAEPVQVAGVEARGRSAEQTARRSEGTKVNLITYDEIREKAAYKHDVTELIRGRFAGVRISDSYDRRGRHVCITVDRATLGGVCQMVAVFIDGVLIADATTTLTDFGLESLESVQLLNPIAAMPRYGERGKNGVLEIYTHGNGPYAHH